MNDQTALNQDTRICFIGDSLVNGTGDETFLGWPGRLCAAAVQSGVALTCYNLGIRRNTSSDLLQRWEKECSQRLPFGCDARLVLSCGINDTVLENGRRRVELSVSRSNIQNLLRDAGKKYKILLIGTPPVNDDAQNISIREINDVFQREAQQLGVPFIEVFSPLIHDHEYRAETSANDGAHPSAKGYQKIAQIIHSSPHWWFRQ